MKSLKSRLRKQEVAAGPGAGGVLTADWNKYDDRLMKAAERGDVEKISFILSKKGVNPTKLDVEGRSVFHVVASKGNLDCLNAILIHGVDIVATDAAGRNALHLAAKYGHALCLQKLLQYNCPTENVDLQGRTALHDAAMSDCSSNVQLLCDDGALVNAKDADGRTPLVLATQMCRPTICQLLLDRGADVNARDKQNRTALMLGCEYGCKDAVEVLLENGADVNLVDSLGHDCYYYARIGDSVEILALLKPAIDVSNKASYEIMKKGQPLLKVTSMRPNWSEPNVLEEGSFKPCWKGHGNIQELESENENLNGKLQEIQRECGNLLNRISELQLQLNEEQMITDDLESEKAGLKRLLAAKEKQQEESLQMLEALKSKLRFYEHDHTGSENILGNRKEDCLLQQDIAYSAESQHTPGSALAVHKSRSMMRPLELLSPSSSSPSEVEVLKQELSNMRSCCEIARGDISKLQLELSHKAAECEALVSEYEKTKQDSDLQIKQLEDALKDVQKRMFDSEGKVKQMQTHFLALKDHLRNDVAVSNSKLPEELKDQLKDMKVKYEGAVGEVGKLRNQLKQNELLVEKFQRDEVRLVEENKKFKKELDILKIEHEKREKMLSEAEDQLKEMATKLTNNYEKMKSSLSSEVEEKAWMLAEMKKEHDKLYAEAQQLRTELKSQEAQFSQHIKAEEHRFMKSRYEQRSKDFERAYSELKQTNHTLQKEVERAHEDNHFLKKEIDTLKNEIQIQYVPLKVNEDMKKASDLMTQELNIKLIEITEKYHKYKAETEMLLEKNTSLRENINHFQTVYVPSEKYEEETGALKFATADLRRQLAELGQKYKEEQAKSLELLSKNSVLKDIMKKQYVPVDTYEGTKTVLNSMLKKTEQELLDLKGEMKDVKQKFVEISEENGALKRKLRALQSQMQCEFISTEVHDKKVVALKETILELQENNSEMLLKYQINQEEVTHLHAEIEAQKTELDMIQECIKSKYASLSSFEEREGNFEATVKELKSQLLEQGEHLIQKEEEINKLRQENEKLRTRLQCIQKDMQQNYILAEKSHEMERMFARKMDDLNKQLRELQQKISEIKYGKERLLEDNARRQPEALNVQSHNALVKQFEALKRMFSSTTEDLKGKLSSKIASWQQELQKVQELQHELANLMETTVPLVEYTQIKEIMEREMATLKASLRDKEGENQAITEEISNLQSEMQSTKQLLKELEGKEVVEMSEHKLVTIRLQDQVCCLAEKLIELNKIFEGMCDKASQVNMEEMSAKEEEKLFEPRSFSIEQEIKDQQERCDRSLSTIAELQRRIQESAKQVEAKDNKITELLKDVERLKQALNSLSQRTYNGGVPVKRQNQQTEILQNQVKTLEQQLAEAERQHQEVISIYRTHLLSAVQGHMDEDVQAALLQIIHMHQGLVCKCN